jgi:hypothetical protein
MPYTTADEVKVDRRRRLLNQRAFRDHFVECSCERGCLVCAYTGLVSKGQARLSRFAPGDGHVQAALGSYPPAL